MSYRRERPQYVIALLVIATCLIAAGLLVSGCKQKPETVRLLAWVGYDEPDLFAEFTAKEGIQVQVTTFIGGAQMLSKLQTSPNRFDVVVLDPEYISLAASQGLLRGMNVSDYDLSHYHPFFMKLPFLQTNAHLYALPVRFGAIGVMYNADKVSSDEVRSYKNLLKPEFKNRISVMNLWQPTMGTLSLMDHPLRGNPYDLSAADLQQLSQRLLELRNSGVRVHANVPDLVSHLTEERTWVMLGGGEANIPALKERNKNFKSIIPDEGGIMWIESLGITKTTPVEGAARKLIQYLQSPSGQVKLARRNTYISTPPSPAAVEMLNQDERQLRGVASKEDLDKLLAKLIVRQLPSDQAAWERIWDAFLRPQN